MIDAAAAEFRSLVDGFETRMVIGAILDHGMPTGRTAELQAHYGLPANAVPAAVAFPWHDGAGNRVEHRAVTTAPADTGAAEAPASIPVFATGLAAYLAIGTPVVAAGDYVPPVLTTAPSVKGPFTASDAAAETDGAFAGVALPPKRLQASFFYRRTDAARFAGMEPALRVALQGGLAEAVDKLIVDQIVADVGRTNAGAADTFASYLSRFVYGQVDGRYANAAAAIRLLMARIR